MTFNDISLPSLGLALFEVKYMLCETKSQPSSFILVQHCLYLCIPSWNKTAASILQEFLPVRLRKHNTSVWNTLTYFRTLLSYIFRTLIYFRIRTAVTLYKIIKHLN